MSKVDKAFSRRWYEILGGSPAGGSLTHWMGYTVVKCPMDLHVYQEILYETRPDVVVETGVFNGGSALYIAHILDALEEQAGHSGAVISIDIEIDRPLPTHPRIDFLLGLSSTDPRVLEIVRDRCEGKKTMVILDSDHSRQHVLKEMDLYAPLVTKGCHLIVEDTNPDGYHLGGGYPDGGPAEAVKEWQPTNKGFAVDRNREKLLVTQNPGGYLCRVR